MAELPRPPSAYKSPFEICTPYRPLNHFHAIIVFFASADTESRMDLSPDDSHYAVGYIRSNGGRLFKNGAEYSVVKKLEVVEKHHFLFEQDGEFPSIRKLATEANVGRGYTTQGDVFVAA